jgi:predicted enzyme related to lactoylglutathione lyase
MGNAIDGQFVWHEHLAKDPKAAIAFYSDVVGWKTQPFAESGPEEYMMWVGSQGPLGGVMQLPEEAAKMGAPPHWMAHVQVANVDTTAAQVKKLGGKIYKEPSDIPTVGRFAVIADPQGASISIFKPNSAMTLHDVTKPGEFCWNELMTSDSAAAFKFYSDIFGWKILQEMEMGPMGTYRVYGVGETQLGGMMTKPKESPMPPMWIYYVETSDLEGAIARATKKGAKVMNGPMDVPGGGRIAQLMDPQGAAFALHHQGKK